LRLVERRIDDRIVGERHYSPRQIQSVNRNL
jgi:hypothetical protein